MGHMNSLYQTVTEMYDDGIPLDQIAVRLNLDLGTVAEIIQEYDDYEYDDSQDGDHDSAMASAGFGTDEDYGYYGEE